MIDELIKKRFSTRAYSERLVEKEKLVELFEAAQWAPSSMNEQPWRFIITTKNEEESFNKLFDTLSDGNKIWAVKAPVLILVSAKKTIDRNGKLNRYSFYDTGSAVAFLVLQAMEMGLYVHQLGGFNVNEAANELNVPNDYEPVVVLVLGYRSDVQDLPENLRVREKAVRTRQPLENIVFEGEFGRSFINDEKALIS
jgi:nitroreductase